MDVNLLPKKTMSSNYNVTIASASARQPIMSRQIAFQLEKGEEKENMGKKWRFARMMLRVLSYMHVSQVGARLI